MAGNALGTGRPWTRHITQSGLHMHFARQPQLPLPYAPKPNRAGPCLLEETSSHVQHRFRPICRFGRKCAAPLFSQSGRPWACPPPLRGARRATPPFLAETGPHDAKKITGSFEQEEEKNNKEARREQFARTQQSARPNGVCVLRGALGGRTSPRARALASPDRAKDRSAHMPRSGHGGAVREDKHAEAARTCHYMGPRRRPSAQARVH